MPLSISRTIRDILKPLDLRQACSVPLSGTSWICLFKRIQDNSWPERPFLMRPRISLPIAQRYDLANVPNDDDDVVEADVDADNGWVWLRLVVSATTRLRGG